MVFQHGFFWVSATHSAKLNLQVHFPIFLCRCCTTSEESLCRGNGYVREHCTFFAPVLVSCSHLVSPSTCQVGKTKVNVSNSCLMRRIKVLQREVLPLTPLCFFVFCWYELQGYCWNSSLCEILEDLCNCVERFECCHESNSFSSLRCQMQKQGVQPLKCEVSVFFRICLLD